MHLVLGATGGFGGAMVRALRARGLPVRALVRDPSRAKLPDGVEIVAGDARRLTDLVPAAKGCESIVHGLNLPYAEWHPGMGLLTDNVVEASGLSGATVVFPGNVYGLKPIYGVPLPPDAPPRDVNDRPNKKGILRLQLEDHLVQNSELRNIRTLIVRSGDFFGPGVDNGLVGPMFRNVLAGTPVPWYGARDTGHAFTYVDDVAHVAVELLTRSDRPTLDIVAVAGDAYESAEDWVAALAKAAGKPAPGVRVVPRWQVKLAGLWNKEAREFAELLYQWEGPILLDDARVRRALPDWRPTPPEQALATTMAWYRENS
ncbi:MAG: NAD(P)H-binding protein [Myxococcota bacterium]